MRGFSSSWSQRSPHFLRPKVPPCLACVLDEDASCGQRAHPCAQWSKTQASKGGTF
jgi:hypothetical protein